MRIKLFDQNLATHLLPISHYFITHTQITNNHTKQDKNIVLQSKISRKISKNYRKKPCSQIKCDWKQHFKIQKTEFKCECEKYDVIIHEWCKCVDKDGKNKILICLAPPKIQLKTTNPKLTLSPLNKHTKFELLCSIKKSKNDTIKPQIQQT